MIIDMHRHLWSIFERYASVREIAARRGIAGIDENMAAPEREARFIDRIDQVKQAVGLDRVLFGSDCPGSSHVMPLAKWVDTFRELPRIAQRHGYHLTDEESALMLGGNAAKLLGVS